VLLQLLRLLNLLTGVLLVGSFVATFLFEPGIREFFTKQPSRIDPGLLIPVLRLWMVLTVPALAAVHILLTRLLEMVGTVRGGDPFVQRMRCG